MTKLSDEQKTDALLAWLRDYAKYIDVHEYDRCRQLPKQLIEDVSSQGFFSLAFAERDGGLGLPLGQVARLLQQIGAIDLNLGAFMVSHHAAGLALASHGSAVLAQSLLPEVASGKRFSTLAISETSAGSNPRAMQTMARPRKGGGWEIQGEKYMIGGAEMAGVFTTFAKTDDGISAFALPSPASGLSIGPPNDMLGLHAYTQHSVLFQKVVADESAILEEPGRGMLVAETCLLFGRFAAAALALGAMKRCLQLMVAYARRRRISTGLLLENPVTGARVYQATAAISAIEAALFAIHSAPSSCPSEVLIALKIAATEHAWEVLDNTMQLLGARGFQENNSVARLFRDARFLRIGEGPTETLSMQLGAVLAARDKSLRSYLTETLGAPDVLNDLDEALDALSREMNREGRFQQQWLWYVAGRLGAYALLRAALIFSRRKGGSLDCEHALSWVTDSFKDLLRHHMALGSVSDVSMEDLELERHVEACNAAVGCLEATIAIPATKVDPLLMPAGQPRGDCMPTDGSRQSGVPEARPVHRLFEAWAERTPIGIALRSPSGETTYAEVDAAANRLAHFLLRRRSEKTGRVAVCMGQTEALIVAVLATLKSGLSFVPLEASYPQQRLAEMSAPASVILTQRCVSDRVPSSERVVVYEEIAEQLSRLPATAPQVDGDPLSEAYLAHTSGSTGSPKPVPISHDALFGQIHWRNHILTLSPADRVLQMAAHSFDIAVWELLGPLAAGASLVLPGSARKEWDGSDVIDLVSRYQVTILQLVPSQLAALLEQGNVAQCRSVRFWALGGEMLHKPLRDRFFSVFDSQILFLYGPTETAIDATFWICKGEHEEPCTPIGRPLPGKYVYILGAENEPLGSGEWGELCIGGRGVARGYLGRPAETAKRFVPDPFAGPAKAVMYRTGDRARWRPDGALEFGGRLDRQLKVRGHRIEPGEIEAALTAHAAVRAAAVDLRERAPGDNRIVAWVEVNEPVTAEGLRDFLSRRLPRSYLPGAYVFCAELPRSPSGKTDYNNLPAVEWTSFSNPPARAAEDSAPSSGLEASLSELMAELLGTEDVAPDGDFFAMGGHSLLALQLLTRVRDRLGVDVRFSEFTASPTLSFLMSRIEPQLTAGPETPERSSPGERTRNPATRLGAAQEQLWFLQRKSPSMSAYNEPWAFRLKGALSLASLQFAYDTVRQRHNALRTCFPEVEGRPAAKILRHGPAELPVLSLQDLPSEARYDRAIEVLRQQAAAPFELSEAPPFRALLVTLSPTDHILLCVFHHIIADGWSIGGIFPRDLSAAYRCHVQGRALSFTPLPMQMAEYNDWVGAHGADNRDLKYWTDRLRGITDDGALPTDHPRRPGAGNNAETLPISFSAAEATVLRESARQYGVTPFVILLSALYLLAKAYRQDPDVVLGTVLANRKTSLVDDLIGNFADMVALRHNPPEDITLAELAQTYNAVLRGALEHDRASFSEVVQAVRPERSDLTNPFFQVAINYFNGAQSTFALPSVDCEEIFLPHGQAKFDILVWLKEDSDSITGYMQFNQNLFEKATTRRILGHFLEAVELLCTNPEVRLGSVSLVNAADEAVQLHWAEEKSSTEQPELVHCLFEANAEQSSGAVAVKLGSEELTYGRLDELANTIAGRLLEAQVPPGTFVGLCFLTSPIMIAAVIGILKAGAAYVPLDPRSPRDRVEWIINDSGIDTILLDAASCEMFAGRALRLLICDQVAGVSSSLPKPSVSVRADQPAYMIYTSGSTGQPKGVVVPHGNLAHLISSADRLFSFRRTDVWTLFHSIAFDFSVWELWGALCHGSCLVLVPYEVSRNPHAFRQLLVDEQVTVLNQTPSAFYQLVDVDGASRENRLERLRYVVFGGEALNFDRVSPWLSRYPESSLKLINMYGITETTVHVTYREVQHSDVGRESLIGKPLPGWEIYLLDPKQRLLPRGAVGEICVGGPGVALGYHNRPELTAQRFIRNPFSTDPSSRLYRSGDLGRYTFDGDIAYCGRSDNQIKLRGFRIELGEVEAALVRHERILQAIVKVCKDPAGRDRLVGYLVTDGLHFDTASLYAFLADLLPDYMVPSRYVRLEKMDLNHNGKLERKRLPEPDWDISTEASEGHRTPVEEKLVELWEQVLEVAGVGVDQSFFELGGDSIRSIRLLAEMKNHGLELSLSDLFRLQTIRKISSKVSANSTAYVDAYKAFSLVSKDDLIMIAPGIVDAYPLTKLQAGMIFNQARNRVLYHDVFTLLVKGRFDAAAFGEAFEHIVQENEILRTSFWLSEFSEPLQLVHASAVSVVMREDISGFDEGDQESFIESYCEAERRRQFDLKAPPLLRLHVHVRGSNAFNVTFSFHHAILDGWSLASLRTKLFKQYSSGLERDGKVASESRPLRFSRHVELEKGALERKESTVFWQSKLSGYKPTDLCFREGSSSFVETIENILDEELAQRIEALAKEVNVPIRTVLLAAHVRVMASLFGQDVVTGVTVQTRPEEPGGDRTLGLFLNSIPCRVRLTGGSWGELIRRCGEAEVELVEHQRFPLAAIRALCGDKARFASLFVTVHFHVYQDLASCSNLRVVEENDFQMTEFPLVSGFFHNPVKGFVEKFRLDYDPSRIEQEVARFVADAHVGVLGMMVDAPEGDYGEYPRDLQRPLLEKDTKRIPEARDEAGDYKNWLPPSRIEERIRGVWMRYLGPVGIHDRFFERGDSLDLLRIVAEVDGDMRKLDLGEFLANPTIATMARLLSPEART
jgi:amino acid adenylation domain-containing protein